MNEIMINKMANLVDENKKLKAENEVLKKEKAKITKRYSLLSNSHTILMNCVEFYADYKSYQKHPDEDTFFTEYRLMVPYSDSERTRLDGKSKTIGGKLARKTLSKLKPS